jgi:hypothetical protein
MISPEYVGLISGPQDLDELRQFSKYYGTWTVFFRDSYALIKDDFVVDVFDTHEEATTNGQSLYGSGFMIQRLNVYYNDGGSFYAKRIPFEYHETH